MSKWVIQIIIALVLGIAGQVLLKEGTGSLNVSVAGAAGPLVLIWRMLTTLPIFLGLVCYGVSSVFYILVLKDKDLSMVYPMIASSYILVVLFAWLFRHEAVSPIRWVGVIVITLGVILISRS
jgi:multidrug transporter EmrE-like cation transporter